MASGRFVSEWWQPTPWWTAVPLTLLCLTIGVWLLRCQTFAHNWPLLLLMPYVLYPDYGLPIVGQVAGLTAVVWLLWRFEIGNLAIGDWQPRISRLQAALSQWAAVFAALCFLLLYGYTISPGLLPADSGEFQLVAARLGVAHPPGFPLYTLLAHAATRLPLPFSAALKVNLLSALSSSLTLAVVYATTHRLTQRHLAAATAVIALGSATTFWAQATTANIRSLTALFAALSFYALLRLWQVRQQPAAADRWLTLFALALSWGITHHPSLLFMGVVAALFALRVNGTFWREPRRWRWPLLAGLSGLLPLLYLPLRANSGAPGASPTLATLSGFLDHVLARGFSGDFFYFTEPEVFWQRLLVMGNVLTFQFFPWLLAGMTLGLLWLLWRQWPLALLLGGSFALHTFITATYRAPQTVEYMLPAYVPLALLLGVGVGALQNGRFPLPTPFNRAPALIGAALLLSMAAAQAARHFPSYALLSRDTTAHDYAHFLLTHAPEQAIILADWHWATPLWYLQQVEGLRPDVQIRFVYPEAAPYGETWAQRIGQELANGRAVIATHFDENAYHSLPPAEPLGEAFLYRLEPLRTLPAGYVPLEITLGGVLRLRGYQLDAATVAVGEETAVRLAWESVGDLPAPLSLFVHLVGADGQLYAQEDLPAQAQAVGLTISQFRLTPRLGTPPGPFVVGAGAYTAVALLSQTGEARTAIANLTVTPMSTPPFTRNPLYRPLVDGARTLRARTLVGYDWDNTLLGRRRLYLHWQTAAGYVTEVSDQTTPQALALPAYVAAWGVPRTSWRLERNWANGRYVPLAQGIVWLGGELTRLTQPVSLPQQFGSSRPVLRDLVVSVRLIGYQPDGFFWAWTEQDDGVPALGAIPTLKWIAGSQVRAPHTLPVPETAVSGQTIGATLRLYDAFTQQPLAILDERITSQFPWVPLGEVTLP